ncbi:hypothetical protein A3C91_00775 [Candidatus Azambacteria bacterium RIFCSPHIGHO2_02_FULL_52_12]|uniref:Uncharacterized protein n=1 Tax=Candidatus Azambacteria bacterium RIFCSPLOWO2_01_FULL_46_25 TaxID=1797298 RepID=A0A1F5BU03_9BACT|nr:MAG: hypothetical protein A3C91_00775 [Candidatus Azambacteria bacterium RIFCSPHIGHO2_02_FULL_52_12]OGD34058.1 MAG: hypothetical protein A2988_01055 [Candidatus Azambacteria bacterium RIFCSPLOWO2_01_FULL_46_25]OGD37809.1 MAG: hypothetical protein A2850_04395 [Candidatus Azambacteria bacterium RIFCSPHIGHO2_01_FULL_51_74]
MKEILPESEQTAGYGTERAELLVQEFMELVDENGFVQFDDHGPMNRTDRQTLANQILKNYDTIRNGEDIDDETKEEAARRMGKARPMLMQMAYRNKFD